MDSDPPPLAGVGTVGRLGMAPALQDHPLAEYNSSGLPEIESDWSKSRVRVRLLPDYFSQGTCRAGLWLGKGTAELN